MMMLAIWRRRTRVYGIDSDDFVSEVGYDDATDLTEMSTETHCTVREGTHVSTPVAER